MYSRRGSLLLPVAHEIAQELILVLAARLVAVGHEREGGVIAVGLDHRLALLVEPLVERAAVADGRPGGALDVVVEPQLIGRDERRLGRTPGVEADVVQAVGLGRCG